MKSYKSPLIGIILIGFLIRFVNIANNPPSLYGDELTMVYDSYSLLETGKDQTGQSYPLTFSMGAGRPAGYVYGSIPFVAFFGPTELGVRALSIFSGIGIIILLFYIGRKLFSEKVGIVAAVVAAFSPWDISISRGGFEAHFALMLALAGIYFFIEAKEKPLFYLISAICFGLTLHTYPTYKITLPIFLILLSWFIGFKSILKSGKKFFLGAMVILIILSVLSVSQTFFGGSENRFFSINVFTQEKSKIEEKINLERTLSSLPNPLPKIFHNKPIEYIKTVGENYIQNLSPDFLFIHGDRNPRHNMATIGGLYFVEAVFIIVGLLSFWKTQKKLMLFLVLWILLAPLPTAFIDSPHALRSILMLPPLILLSALGLMTLLDKKNKLALRILGIIFVIQLIFFLQKLYFLSPNEYALFWAYSAKVASHLAIKNQNSYDYIFLSDRIDNIEFAYPVYSKIHPNEVISQNSQRTNLEGRQFKKFNNVYIGNVQNEMDKTFIEKLNGSVLYITAPSEEEYPQGYDTIIGKDGLPQVIFFKKQ